MTSTDDDAPPRHGNRAHGRRIPSPIILAPVGNQQQLHPDGELATARAAKKRDHLMIASMMTNYNMQEIAAETDKRWMQLYMSPNRDFIKALMLRKVIIVRWCLRSTGRGEVITRLQTGFVSRVKRAVRATYRGSVISSSIAAAGASVIRR